MEKNEEKKLLDLALQKRWITPSECEEILEKQQKIQKESPEISGTLKNFLLEEGLFSRSMIHSLRKELMDPSEGPRVDPKEVDLLFQEVGKGGGDSFVFGEYEVFDFINSGGMGAVYKARHRKKGEVFALKISASLEESEKKHLRFIREIQILSKIAQHPNLIKIHDFGSEGGRDFLVMDYLEGESLNRALLRLSLSHQQWLYQFIPLLGAVEKLHENRIIHRDMKPENLMVIEKKKLVLIDFGLGKILDSSEGSPVQLTTQILGTPYYMAPEQTEPDGNHDHRTDIWALGVILYQILTRTLPFQNDDINRLFHGIRYQNPPKMVSMDPTIPSGLEAVCQKALQKSKKDRYQSVGEMKEEIKEVLGITSL